MSQRQWEQGGNDNTCAGASVQTVTAFVSASVMVGLATMPVEIKAFGKKFTILRNSLSFLLALLLAFLMGVIL